VDDKIKRMLQQSLTSSWAAGDDRFPERIIKSFRDGLPQFEKYYGPVPEEVLEEIIKERFPDQAPEPMAVTSAPTPEEMGPRIKPVKTVPEPSEEVWTLTPVQMSWADEVIAEAFPEPKPKRKVTYDPRNNAKDLAKTLMVIFFNVDKKRRRKGFRISQIFDQVEWVHQITERTMRTYLEELYKEGKIKMWRERVTLDTGQAVYFHWYTSTANPDPKYTLWIQK
jgi:hypothetical protein